ncbi:hypothetical protein [Glycomyces paridis]|uniref:Uncharacterized protein n=1 Tax=Glycomyces paridis TaxID=2126555 RepID=A0A4S8P6S0_9ACTN|nr:hypothetical protein [Glycomyces paridis]THV23514.1 hypothetical protein E9998_23240 [Glycomyces paridis]
MRRGICVKCGSDRIYVLGAYTAEPDLRLSWRPTLKADSHFLVCHACGYVERYLNADRLHLLPGIGTPLSEAQRQAAGG